MLVQGNSGTRIQVKIRDNRKFVNLTDATVELVIRCGNRKFIKTARVISLGTVETVLTSGDLSTAGTYIVYAVCNFNDGTQFASSVDRFEVTPRY
jgi:hypothetical protein